MKESSQVDANWKECLYLIMSPRECSQKQEIALHCTSYSFTTSDPLDVEGM